MPLGLAGARSRRQGSPESHAIAHSFSQRFFFAWLAVACTGNGPSSVTANGGAFAAGGAGESGGLAPAAGRGSEGGAGASVGGTTGGQVAMAGTSGHAEIAGAAGTGASAAAGGTGIPTSCMTSGPGLDDCGANHEDCCTSITVPAGTFSRSSTSNGSVVTYSDPATVSAYRLDKYLVTVGRFREFVAAWNGGDGYTPPAGSGKHTHLNDGHGLEISGAPGTYEVGWDEKFDTKLQLTHDNLRCDEAYSTWSDAAGTGDTLPANCVNWWEAYAFCIWDGGFLPSEAEFMYAAAGGSEQRKYPWGAQDPGSNFLYAICNCNYPDGAGTCTGAANIAVVGAATLGVGRFGHFDLAGDVTEWLLDWMAPAFVTPCTDCANVANGSGRILRDGFYSSNDAALQVSYRNSLYPGNRFPSLGFRCARAPQ